jgi:hypothetical protein
VIRRRFQPPNFICKYVDPLVDPNREETRLAYAASEQELRQRLEAKQFVVRSVQPYDFAAWKTKALEETGKAVEARQRGEPYEFKAAIWSELKEYLFDCFDGKCAYCEAKVQHVSSGDVEHYRPKKRVEEDPAHPGYYWLAYSEENFLPCCEKCNRARAKMNHFPVAGSRAVRPGDDLGQEKPLLLNPYRDEPARHLKFLPNVDGTFIGTVAGITPEGRESVRLYNLNREPLRDARAGAQHTALDRVLTAMVRGELAGVLHAMSAGCCEFSAACLVVVRAWWEQQRRAVEDELRNAAMGAGG